MTHAYNRGSVPAWITRRIGKLVQLTAPIDGHPAGACGVLLSVASKARWGTTGVYCTVALNLGDMSDESNAEVQQLRVPALIAR